MFRELHDDERAGLHGLSLVCRWRSVYSSGNLGILNLDFIAGDTVDMETLNLDDL